MKCWPDRGVCCVRCSLVRWGPHARRSRPTVQPGCIWHVDLATALAFAATNLASAVIICTGTQGAKLASPNAADVTHSGVVQSDKVCPPQEVRLVSKDLVLRQINAIR